MHELAVAESLLNIVENVDRRAPRTRSAAARQNPRPLGRGGFTKSTGFSGSVKSFPRREAVHTGA
jgi:hypothetical protein